MKCLDISYLLLTEREEILYIVNKARREINEQMVDRNFSISLDIIYFPYQYVSLLTCTQTYICACVKKI